MINRMGAGDRLPAALSRAQTALDGAAGTAHHGFGTFGLWEHELVSLVTLSATYGAGGSEVGPALAQRLGVPFVDRLIPSEVAARLAVPLAAAFARDEVSTGVLARVLTSLAPIGQAFGAEAAATEPVTDSDFWQMTEQVVFERADSGQGVILGRAAAVVLRDDPRALHVRLDGPREARLLQAMRLQGIGRAAAERRMQETDRARHAYVHRFHRADARDPTLYHLLIDSTAIDLAGCVEIIALAVAGRTRQVARGGSLRT
jgi:cytidylate kinase